MLEELENLTDRARKVVALANQEANRCNNEFIDAEHILLGMVREGSGVAANVLRCLGVDVAKVRQEVEKLVEHGPGSVSMGRLPMTPRANKVIERAVEESRDLSHKYVGTEHLLLGLLREHDGGAAQVLVNLGVTLDDARKKVVELLTAGENDGTPPTATPSAQRASFERFTDGARIAMALANQEAQRLHHGYIGTEHILLGLANERTGIAAVVLKSMGADLTKTRHEVERLVQPSGGSPTPRAKKVIEYAIEEARSYHHNYIGTEHMLLGLLREQSGAAAQVLINLGLKLDDVRKKLLERLVAESGSD